MKEKNKTRMLFGLGIVGALIAGFMFYMVLVVGIDATITNVKKSIQVNPMTRVNAVLNIYEDKDTYYCSFENHVLLIIEPVMHMTLDFDGYEFEIKSIVQNVSEGLLTIHDNIIIDDIDIEGQIGLLQAKLGPDWKKVDRGL